MLASAHSSAYICFRCQTHAARRRIAASAFHYARHLSQSLSRRDDEQKQRPEARPKKNQRKIYPHGKLRGKKGGELRESSEVLPVNALGKPAEIILLKDADLDRMDDKNEATVEMSSAPQKPKNSSKKAVLDAVEKASATDDAASTFRSMEELRDTILKRPFERGDVITKVEHDTLLRALSEGFTGSQLKLYIASKRSNLTFRPKKEMNTLPHSDWIAGVSPADQKHLILTGQATTRTISKTLSKQKYARLIIERGWQLHVDQGTAIGEIDVYDAQSFLQARNEDGVLILNEIADARHVKVEALTAKLVRITGDKAACQAALHDISRKCMTVIDTTVELIAVKPDGVQSTGSKSGSLASGQNLKHYISLMARNPLSTADLEVLRTTTGVLASTVFDRNRNRTYLRIRAHSDGQMQDALRAVYSMANIATRYNAYAATIRGSQEAITPGPPLPDHMLPYHDRGSNSSRAVSVLEKQSSNDLKFNSSQSSTLVDAVGELSSSSGPQVHDSLIWSSSTDQSLQTRVGIAYDCAEGNMKGSLATPFNATGKFVPCITNLIPLVTQLSRPSSLDSINATQSLVSFIFRQVPAGSDSVNVRPMSAKSTFLEKALPELRFDFDLPQQDGAVPSLKSVHAVLQNNDYCISLSEKALDFAVTSLRSCEVNMQSTFAKTIFTPWINEMMATMQGNSRLRAPLTIDVPIPRTWGVARLKNKMLQCKEAELKTGHLKARYRFVGVVHKQSIGFRTGEDAMTISSVNSGKLGASYMELSINHEVGPQIKRKAKEAKAIYQRALEAGFRLVELADRGARGTLTYDTVDDARDVDEDPGIATNAMNMDTSSLEPAQDDTLSVGSAEHFKEELENHRVAAAG